MKPFMFVIRGTPSADNADRKLLSRALIHIWVFESTMDQALNKAKAYISDYSWIPQSVEYAFEIQPQQILDLGADEALLYQRAQQFGIAADIVAVPLIQNDSAVPPS